MAIQKSFDMTPKNWIWCFALLITSHTIGQKQAHPFVKGVYGNPGTLLKAGYAFDSLGMNAVFVRSISLNQAFYDQARRQGCKVYVEFPTLYGKDYLKDHPEAWPMTDQGERAVQADWFMGICPTDSGFKAFRSNQLRTILSSFEVDGIFLDYLHWHAQFETTHPILPETCFCPRCLNKFALHIGTQIPGEKTVDKARWILMHQHQAWRQWRNNILNGWVTDMKAILNNSRPGALLGVFYCAWYPADHDSALYRILGIDVQALARQADVLSPMLFHKMEGKPTSWVGDYIRWLGSLTKALPGAGPLIWPIVQAHNVPDVVTAGEFKRVMEEASRSPASGIMMFSDQSLTDDPRKLQIMKDLYQKGF